MTTTKMLISAQRAQQLRVAIVEGNTLKDYQVDITDHCLSRGNIYRGVVANVQPSLNAAFIDIGEERHGFLPVGDVSPSAYHHKVGDDVKRPRIDQVLQRGKTILVQVTKDGTGQKGAALTTNISIAGRYLVHTPFDSTRGISRKAEDDAARKKIRDRLKKLTLPEGQGIIVRTNGLGQNQTTLNRDLNALVRLWTKVKAEISRGTGPRLLYTDQDLVVQALRDYLDSTIEEVLVDDKKVFEQAESYMQAFMPRSKTKLTLYNERLPLFSRYRLETQIDRITDRTVPLPSGGYLVIDPTEALTAIDVNSGRATKTANHDDSIFQVNLEAAQEVARHLRLRDIGGLVVVDFIDMRLSKHKNKLEKALRDAMKEDKARYSVHRLSPNGLLEINRQRIKQALQLRTHRPCPSCQGVGTIASPDFAALSLLGRLEARVATGLVDRVTIALHPEVADVLQNQHRRRLATIEEELDLEIEILSASSFDRTEERIEVHQRESVPATAKPTSVLSSTDLATPSTQLRTRKPVEDAEQDSDGEEENGRSRKRRRRRRSPRRVARGDEAVSTQDQSAETQSPQTQGPQTQSPQTQGPQTQSPQTQGPQTQGPQTQATSDEGGESQAIQALAEDEVAAAKPRSRTRRPRRRRRSVSTTSAETAPPTEGSPEPPPSANATALDAPEKGLPSRRRQASGRPRRRVATSRTAPGTMADTISNDSVAQELQPEGPKEAPKRTRAPRPRTARSRTTRSEATETKAVESEAPQAKAAKPNLTQPKTTEVKTPEAKTSEAKTSEAKTPEAKTSEAKTSEAKTSEAKTPEAKKARPRTTRSRATSRKTAQAKAAPEGEKPPSNDQEETKPQPSGRRRLPSRRKPAASSDLDTPSNKDQPKGTAKPQPSEAPTTTPRRRSVSPRRRTSGTTTPKAKPTSLEEQPPPSFQEEAAPRRRENASSNKLRWQWWGGGGSSDQGAAPEGGNTAPAANSLANKGSSEGGDNFPGKEGS